MDMKRAAVGVAERRPELRTRRCTRARAEDMGGWDGGSRVGGEGRFECTDRKEQRRRPRAGEKGRRARREMTNDRENTKGCCTTGRSGVAQVQEKQPSTQERERARHRLVEVWTSSENHRFVGLGCGYFGQAPSRAEMRVLPRAPLHAMPAPCTSPSLAHHAAPLHSDDLRDTRANALASCARTN